MKIRKNCLFLAAACLAAFALASTASAQTCPVVVDCLEPQPLPVALDAKFAWGTTGDEATDGWIARYERKAKEPTWKVAIKGPGTETVSSVIYTEAGEILVTGSTTSTGLDGFGGRNSGGRDGFLARFDAETGTFLSGTLVGGSGDEELFGATLDGRGNIVVIGGGDGTIKPVGFTEPSVTIVEPSASVERHAAFVSTFDLTASRELSRHGLKLRVKKPRIWIDCHGNIVIGVTAMTGECNGGWPDLIYEQDQIAADYDIDHDWNDTTGNLGYPPGGWGYHALRWKDYHANAGLPSGDPPYILDWGLVPSGTDVPKDWNPSCSDASTLNQLETQIFTQNGIPTDPAGSWVCGDHSSMIELAVFSAHFFTRWGTPVYTHLGEWDNINGPWVWRTNPVGLEHVTFRPFCPFDGNAYNGETLDDLCDLNVNSVDDLTCQTSSGTVGVDAGTYYLRFERFEGASWGLPLVWWLRPDIWVRDMDWWWQEWYEAGEYLMDPPVGSENEVAIIQEAARQLSSQIVQAGTVDVTYVTKGRVTCSAQAEAVFPIDR